MLKTVPKFICSKILEVNLLEVIRIRQGDEDGNLHDGIRGITSHVVLPCDTLHVMV